MVGLAAAVVTRGAWAQERAVRFILPDATGSGVDTITRTAQAALAKALASIGRGRLTIGT